MTSEEAFVTLTTNDPYSLGCLVLGRSLRRVGTSRHLVVMITEGVSQAMRDQLQSVFDLVYLVNIIDSEDPINLQVLGRPDLNVTFTKLHCWKLTQYKKAVFMDADTMVLQNVDELFERDELSAAPDAGWPDCFNSGVFVFKPSLATYASLVDFALTHGSFDGGDQGLLNLYFSDWAHKDISRHLPFIYNVVSQAFYSYLPAFARFRNNVKIVHFIGANKPWHQKYDRKTGDLQVWPDTRHDVEFLRLWWEIFSADIRPELNTVLSEMFSHLLSVNNGCGDSPFQRSSEERKLAWERGEIDYTGMDSFANIQKQLDTTMEKGAPAKLVSASTAPFPSVPLGSPSTKPLVGHSTDSARFMAFNSEKYAVNCGSFIQTEYISDKHPNCGINENLKPSLTSMSGSTDDTINNVAPDLISDTSTNVCKAPVMKGAFTGRIMPFLPSISSPPEVREDVRGSPSVQGPGSPIVLNVQGSPAAPYSPVPPNYRIQYASTQHSLDETSRTNPLTLKFRHPDVKPSRSRESPRKSPDRTPYMSQFSHPDFIKPDMKCPDSPVSTLRMGIACADQWNPKKRIQVATSKSSPTQSTLSVPLDVRRYPSKNSSGATKHKDHSNKGSI